MSTKKALAIVVAIIVLLALYFVVSALGTPEAEPNDENPDTGQRAIPESITLSPGESGSAGGVLLTLHQITEDSRCPVDAVCVQEGRVRILFSASGGDPFEMHSDESTEIFINTDDGTVSYFVSIERVLPARYSSREEIAQSEYEVTFVVTRNDTMGLVPWEDAISILYSGRVRTAAIFHNGHANLLLEDGSSVESIPPSEEVFWHAIESCGAPCADMAIAME